MDCVRFEELMSEYLDGGLLRAERRQFAEHLLACRDCHSLFDDVRDTMVVCHSLKDITVNATPQFQAFEQRLLNATSAGEMLSCSTLDALISDYFEGLIEGTSETIFTSHFNACERCHQLVEGVRQSLEESEAIEIPDHLYFRIIAATSGARR
jgi:anti-sigma factor RsiW